MSQSPTNLFSTSGSALAPLELTVSGPGWDGGERHVLEQSFALVGRDERCCLRLDDDAVSRRHAYLQQLGERVFCVDLGSRTGTRWAGVSHPSGWLLPNDGIQIGPFTLELANGAWSNGSSREPGAEAGNPLQDRINDRPGLPSFRIAVGNEVRSQFRMNRDLVLVGSGPDCRVRLRDAGISRYHCSLVRTPGGLWVIDLLSGTGTRLNGEPIRCARVNEGDLLRVGQYLLRLGYEGEGITTRSTLPPEYRMEAPVQRAEDTSKSERLADLAPTLQVELDHLRERLRDTEILRQHLADRETECGRLREQAGTFDKQTAELAELKARLEIAETMTGKLEEIAGERDHWQTRTQALQTEIESSLGERQDYRQQLEAAQQQLAEKDEAVRAAKGRLEEQSAILQQLQQAHEELARERDKARDLQAELDRALHHQEDAEALRQQLTDARSKHDELGVRILQLESRAASVDQLADRIREAEAESQQLREQLQAAQSQMAELEYLKRQLESAAGKLEEISSERDRWQSQAQSVQAQIESGLAEREELRQRLEAAQQQHAEKDEAVRAANGRLDEQSAALQQMQETQEELSRLRDKTRDLQAELDQVRHHQQDAESLRQQLTDARSKHDEVGVRVLELESRAASVDQLADRIREAEAESQQLREQLQTVQSQTVELEDLKRQLDSAAGKLEEVGSERDRWQFETQSVQAQIESGLAEREELRQRLEAAQQQHAEKDEAVRAANARLEQQSAILQQLQETHQELARAHDKTRELLTELDQARHHQQDAEALRQQLADAQNKHDELAARVGELEGTATSADRLRESEAEAEGLRHQVRVLELRVTEADDLIARLESAETDARDLEEIRGERDRWQVEVQTLHNRIASDLVEREQLVRVTEELLGVQAERDRLLAEQQTSPQEDEQALAQVAEVERALAEANAAHEKALSEERAGWESERQALKGLIEQARSADHDSAQAMVREVQARFAAERQELKLRLEGAEAQIVWERGLAQEQSEQLRRQVSALQAERDRLVARQAQPVSFVASAGERSQERADRPVETNPSRQLTMQDQALALFFGLGVGHPHEQSARAAGANRPAEPARPRSQPVGEGSQQAHLPSIEQGVDDAWTQAATRRQSPAIQAEAGQAGNPPDAAQEKPATAEEEQPGEVADSWISQPKDEERSGLWRKIVNLVRRK